MKNCEKIINDFLKSSNENMNIIYNHRGKIDIEKGYAEYKNIKCEMNFVNFEELKNHSSRFTSKTHSDKIYDERGIEYIVPGKIILNSK
jgi:hypothetical protein